MFRENNQHGQSHLFSTLSDLPAGMREMLEQSWAGVFRREVFERLNEKPFAALYRENDSRPNVAVNVLVCLDVLKSGFGWTDEQMYQAFVFDLQVRYALGYENLGDGHFHMRTVYNFRQRLSQHMQRTGENLLEQAFEAITDKQIGALALQTDKLRVDSTQIASDMRTGSRLQLLVEVLGRVYMMLTPQDQERYAELLAPYSKGKASHFVYRLQRGQYAEKLAGIGPVMHQLLAELASDYGDEEAYGLLQRAFGDHFIWTEAEQRLKEPGELSGESLQAVSDPEATYRTKQGKSYQGYVSNITETCNPENPVQLIVKVQTEANVSDDQQMLVEALPNLQERTEVKELYTDGGYNGPDLDEALDDTAIVHKASAIRGGRPAEGQLGLADFGWESNDDGRPVQLTCPQGQVIPVEPGRGRNRFIARPDGAACEACPLLALCPMRPQGNERTSILYFNQRSFRVALKRQQVAAGQGAGNLRAAVEATVRSVKQPFRHGRVLLRGRFRVACAVLGSALMVNVRRLHRAHAQKPTQSPANQSDLAILAPFARIFGLITALTGLLSLCQALAGSCGRRSLRPFPLAPAQGPLAG